MTSVDPTTLWFYRAALAAVALLCVGGFVALVSRAVATIGTRAGGQGVAGLLAWWAKNGKTYTVVAGAIGALLYDHFINGAPLNWAGLFEAVGAGTLRAAIAKNQKATEVATTAAKIAAFKADPPKEGL